MHILMQTKELYPKYILYLGPFLVFKKQIFSLKNNLFRSFRKIITHTCMYCLS